LALASGTRLGPYEILSALGAGGMGEVYKARDTRLARTVAVKVLPDAVAGEASFRARFEREARAIAALSHPHICAIYDVGRDGTGAAPAVDFIVMEYLEGETLADRLARSAVPLPLDQVLTIGAAVADALDRAHRAGIVHRDLKPANVMLTRSGPKLLDFGLAKALHADATGETTKALTDSHTIVGTIHYMAPEQVEGHDTDHRTDLWALGVMLYEMATGQRPFAGDSAASVMSAILRDRAPLVSARQPLTPASVDHIVDRCLQKDPDDRWQNAGDVKRELQWIANAKTSGVIAASSTRVAPIRSVWWFAVPALLIGLIAGAVIARQFTRPVNTTDGAEPIAVSILPPPGTSFPLEIGAPWPLISPDARQLAFVAVTTAGTQQLWLRPLDSDVARPLAGSEGAARPFWSPDNRSVGFFADGKIKRVDLPNGTPQVVCDAPYLGGMSATWGSQGVIVFTHVGGVFRVNASGGTPQRVLTDLAESGRRDSPQNPSFLPDGRHFVYVVQRSSREDDEICVASIDPGDPRCFVKLSSPARYAEPGYLLFVRDGTLRLQPFSVERLALEGESVPVGSTYVNVEPVYRPPPFSISARALAYHPGTGTSRLAWMDRAGQVLSTVGDRGDSNASVSRDGSRIVVSRTDQQHAGNIDLWLRDAGSDVWSRFTFDPAPENGAIFSPDGSRVVYSTRRGGTSELWIKATGGIATPQRLAVSQDAVEMTPQDWSSDGQFILVGVYSPATSWDIARIPVNGGRRELLLNSTHGERDGKLSPDMHWIAYDSTESGRREIWIQPLPPNGSRWQVSNGGGTAARWRADGRELFYIAADGKLMAVPVTPGETPKFGSPTALFQTLQREGGGSYTPSPDGQRFLVNVPLTAAETNPISVIVNWRSTIDKR
jgi:serine/threonine protein kinase/Tol biopolymer transport system component